MSRRITVAVGLVLAFAVVGLAVTALQRARLNAQVEESRNNLRQIALFAAHNADPNAPLGTLTKGATEKLPREIPAATIVLQGVPPDDRLSWVVAILPALDQRKHRSDIFLSQLKLDQPWSAAPNQEVAIARLTVLLCPGRAPSTPTGFPAPTCYVGIAGVGADAATLALVPGLPTPGRAGPFRYDAPTPFDRITDGLSQSLLFGETADSPGSWLRGGFSTTRGFDTAPGAKPYLGGGGQFGGYFPNSTNFAICDGSVRTFTQRVTPDVLLKLATIAGGEEELVPED
ncbi:MAG: hypothetical protein C0467_15180 [Planctomycetaceae bacterium]|nr:hypothetical protein [Planctomycetaceae bacterium]